MIGYLGQPERTAEAVQDGWYVTGDIGAVDDEGFIRITDRLARFSKIGGEMVPHLKVEEYMYQIAGEYPCAVTGVPDDQRGERLVALYTRVDMSPSELWQKLSSTDLPKLWIPKRENIYQVESIPTLGTGKLDLQGVKERARQLAAAFAVES
jgi:acyl-[acyl-carrier-protein]-phospholipid O-acyltransferase/long-chain-fatty-acid--[acyl-carrier-protein] ligase